MPPRARSSARSRASTPLACETVFASQRLSSGSLSPLCQPVPLGSISPNPRCWYRETRWSASNQRQDPSSSSASSYSRGRLKFEGEAEVRRGCSLSLSLSFSFTHSLNHSSSFSFSLHLSSIVLQSHTLLSPPSFSGCLRRRFNNFDP